MNIIPISGQCKVKPLSATDSSGSSSSMTLPATGNQMVVVNEGPSIAFFSVGAGAQTATLPNSTPTATSTPILPGYERTFTIPTEATHIAAVCRSGGTATLSVYVGEGA